MPNLQKNDSSDIPSVNQGDAYPSKWIIIDNGAIYHITGKLKLFHSYKLTSGKEVSGKEKVSVAWKYISYELLCGSWYFIICS